MNIELKTRAEVCAEILKQPALFKAVDVSRALNLSRQAVWYHLQQLTGEGLIEKQGSKYLLLDQHKLIDRMLDSASDTKVRRAENGAVLRLSFSDLQILTDTVCWFRALNLDESIDLKTQLATLLKQAADSLMAERKYLLERVVSPGSARKQIRAKAGSLDQWYLEVAEAIAKGLEYEWIGSSDDRTSQFVERMEDSE